MENLIKALTILLKYGNPEFPTVCTHEKLYVVNILIETISEEDIIILDGLGFIVNVGTYEIYSYKYGSA